MNNYLILLLLSAPPAGAQVPTPLVNRALERASTVSFARSDLKDARERLGRLRADSLTTRQDLLGAQQALDAAGRAVLAARLEVRAGLTRELLALGEARDNLRLGRLRAELADLKARAAALRFGAGAINAVELARVRGEASAATAEVRRLEAAVSAVSGALTRRLGAVPRDVTPSPTPRPQLGALRAALENHPRVAEARAALERARFDLALRDNEFTPQVERAAARSAAAGAGRRVADARMGAQADLGAAWNAYAAAQAALPGAERSVAQAREELGAQQTRLARGVVSKLDVLGGQIALEAARLALSQARNRLTLAVVDLALAAGVDVWARAEGGT